MLATKPAAAASAAPVEIASSTPAVKAPEKLFAVVALCASSCLNLIDVGVFSITVATAAGKQFKVTRHDVVMTNKLDAEVGRSIRLEKVRIVEMGMVFF